MIRTLPLPLLALALLTLSGCAAFDSAELEKMPARGVPAPLIHKVQANQPLLPDEVAILCRHGVSTDGLVRYIHRNGVTYLMTPEDSRRLRKSGVPPPVIDALVTEGSGFARDYGRNGRPVTGLRADDPYQSFPDPNGFEW